MRRHLLSLQAMSVNFKKDTNYIYTYIYTLVILRNGKNVENTHKKPVTDKDT